MSQKECRTQSEAVTHLGFLAVSPSTVSASIRMDASSIGVTLYDGFPMRMKCFVVQKKKQSKCLCHQPGKRLESSSEMRWTKQNICSVSDTERTLVAPPETQWWVWYWWLTSESSSHRHKDNWLNSVPNPSQSYYSRKLRTLTQSLGAQEALSQMQCLPDSTH